MKYKVGDKVRIVANAEEEDDCDSVFSKYIGEKTTVRSVNESREYPYALDGIDGIWQDEELEPVKETAYKVGDKVKIREDLKEGDGNFQERATQEMLRYRGAIATVGEGTNGFFFLDVDDGEWCWTEEMVEPVEESALDKPACEMFKDAGFSAGAEYTKKEKGETTIFSVCNDTVTIMVDKDGESTKMDIPYKLVFAAAKALEEIRGVQDEV